MTGQIPFFCDYFGPIGFVLIGCCHKNKVTGVSTATGLKSGQFNRKRNSEKANIEE
jgi:hypothetical protein